jgi:folate-dependent phosphoribosylglycinamide formyltransferase PurN
MLSGRGRTLANLLDACHDGVLRRAAHIRLVIASSDSPGAQLARDASWGVPTRIIPGTIPAADLAALAHQHACSLVILAGYLRKVEIHPSLARRILNIHPAILTHDHDPAPLLSRGMRESDLAANFGGPGLFGERVHRAVIASGAPISGCTVHLCDAAFDTGPILLRRTCPVEPTDTPESLAARVFAEERIAYPEAIARALGVWNPNAPGASNP